jgi:DNA-binding CsgD family transcriptional regulator
MPATSRFDVDSPCGDRSSGIQTAIAGAEDQPSLPCDPSELWSQLVEGNFKIIEYFNTDNRCYLVAATRPAAEVEAARLTVRELEILTRTLLGAPQKVTAIELAVAPSTVASHLARALQKLDLSVSTPAIPLALVLVCQAACGGAVLGDARVTALQLGDVNQVVVSVACPEKRLPELTAAEQDVAAAFAAGSTKVEIARARSTSINTIGRQISSAIGKLGVRGRFDLVRRMGGEAVACGENTAHTMETVSAAPQPRQGAAG